MKTLTYTGPDKTTRVRDGVATIELVKGEPVEVRDSTADRLKGKNFKIGGDTEAATSLAASGSADKKTDATKPRAKQKPKGSSA